MTIKTKLQLLAILVVTPLAAILAQGPLVPPGAPAPTMKTLQQIEPRIAIKSLNGDSDSTYVIVSSGSYYLTRNLTGSAGKNGIKILTGNVALDLNGFELVGGPARSPALPSGRPSWRSGKVEVRDG